MAPSPEYPHQDGDVTVLGPETFASNNGTVICWKGENYVPQKRLRLAHQARRAKEHQLDDIRRALCDIGFMEDDDPYSHADLANVIRQNGQALLDLAETAPSDVVVRVGNATISGAVQADTARHMDYIRGAQGGTV